MPSDTVDVAALAPFLGVAVPNRRRALLTSAAAIAAAVAAGASGETPSDDEAAAAAAEAEAQADAEASAAQDDPEDDEEDDDDKKDDEKMQAAAAIANPVERRRAVSKATRKVKARTRAKAEKSEQARIAGILTHPKAANAPAQATHLALATRISSVDARKLLDQAPRAAAGGLATRMAAQPPINLGAGGHPERPAAAAVASAWDASLTRARPAALRAAAPAR